MSTLAETIVTHTEPSRTLGLGGSGLISVLIDLLVFALIVWLVFWVVGLMGLPEPIRRVVTIVVGVICLLFLLSRLGIGL
jgi:hypothetical protein